MLEWEDVVIAPYSFLDGTIESFDFGNMLVSSSDVELCMEVGNISAQLFELIVSEDDGDSKAASDICANNSSKVLDNVAVLHRIKLAR